VIAAENSRRRMEMTFCARVRRGSARVSSDRSVPIARGSRPLGNWATDVTFRDSARCVRLSESGDSGGGSLRTRRTRAECKPNLLPDSFDLCVEKGLSFYIILPQNGTKCPFRQVARVVGNRRVAVRRCMEPDLMAAGRLTVEREAESP